MARSLSPRERRAQDSARDLLHVGTSRTAPEFEDESLPSRFNEDSRLPTNAHPETEYEDMRRLPSVGHYDSSLPYDEAFSTSRPGLSPRVRSQVFGQIGERNGTMSFQSLLSPARSDDQENDRTEADTPPGERPRNSQRTTIIPNARPTRAQGGF